MGKKSKKILFIYPARENESLAIEYLSSCLKIAGHITNLIIGYSEEKNFNKRLFQRIESFKPDFIGLSVMTDDYSWACKTSKFIKSNFKTPIIFGGLHPTSCPEEVISNDFVDYIVIGEGEDAIVDLVENPEKTNIKNVWTKKNGKIIKNPLRPLIEDLDTIPFPDKDLYFKEAPYLRRIAYFCMTSRGCPFSCTYCFNNSMRKLYKGCKWLRKRSINNVIEELKTMKKNLGFKRIIFGDDCLTYDKRWLEDFFKIYKKEINLPFKAIAHPTFMNKDIISILKLGGCNRIQLGVQTPVERLRKDICKRVDTNEVISNAVKEIKRQGIFVQIDHIWGLPTETVEENKKWISFYIDMKPHNISCYFLLYYPKTDMIKIGKKYGTIDDEFINKTIKGDFNFCTNIEKFKKYPEIVEMTRFLNWIPILPRGLSYYLLRKNLYQKIFISDSLNRVPYILLNLKSLDFIKPSVESIFRKRAMKKYYKNI